MDLFAPVLFRIGITSSLDLEAGRVYDSQFLQRDRVKQAFPVRKIIKTKSQNEPESLNKNFFFNACIS